MAEDHGVGGSNPPAPILRLFIFLDHSTPSRAQVASLRRLLKLHYEKLINLAKIRICMKKKREREGIRTFIIRDSSLEKHFRILITLLFSVCLGVMLFFNISYTGFAVHDSGEAVVESGERIMRGSVEFFGIGKSPDRKLDISLESEFPLDIYVKEGYCSSWNDFGGNAASFEEVVSESFVVGSRFGSEEERRMYESGNVCLMASLSEDFNDQTNLIKIVAKEK